jgi:CRP-like cAMP-binding protein
MNLQEARRRMAKTGWLEAAPAPFADALLASSRLKRVASGKVFSAAGGAEGSAWGIVDGQVALTSAMNSVDAPIGLLYNAGDWGGYLPLFGTPRMGDARAVVPSLLLQVPLPDVHNVLAADPGGWEFLGRLVLKDSLRFASVAVDLLLGDPERRFAAILLHQVGCRRAGRAAWSIHLSQAEIGEMANLSRQPTRRILRDFAVRGWIKSGYRLIQVLDANALRGVADGA